MGQGALSKPVVQWWLSLNSSSRREALGIKIYSGVDNSTCGHRKLVFLVRTPNPQTVTTPDFDLPLPTAASSS